MTQVTEYAMRALAYGLVDRLTHRKPYNANPDLAINNLERRDYYGFSKCTVNLGWYMDLLKPLQINAEDLMIEFAWAIGENERLHYHKEAHAINLVLGPKQGVEAPHKDSYIQCGASPRSRIKARPDTIVYFPRLMHHTFSGPPGSTITFLSIQSPPLETPERNDFFWV